MKVCIAEKPSVAREIALILGAKQKCDGYFEGNGYQITWTFGHLCTLKEPHDYFTEWKRWDYTQLPMIPSRFGIKLVGNKGVEKQFNTIARLVGEAEEVINCGDAGQEGELIQRWVLQLANCKVPVKRLWISSLTEESIRQGFSKLVDGTQFDLLYEAGLSRAVGDWLLGMNITRLYTLKYGKNKQVLSIGRVQTPTLALIVNRQLEIENFKPEMYWELKTTYRDVIFNSSEGKYSNKEKATLFLAEVEKEDFQIVGVEQKDGIEGAPRLFDLTSLQVECNKKYGFSADQTLRYIQALYEKKITTYPRVDTTYLSEDIYPKVPKILGDLKGYEELTAPLLETKIRKSTKVFNNNKVTDHHAIIPTGAPEALNLQGDELKVYTMVTLRFIAAFYPDCKVSNTAVLGKVGTIEFKTSGRQILIPGWRVVFGKDAPDKQEVQILPLFVLYEKGPHTPDLQEKMTLPPRYYTEATLLRSMEMAGKQIDDEELRDAMKENGIGRPSTRANIIETLFKRNYIYKEKKNLKATVVGVGIIDVIQEDLLKSAELTGLWENKLRKIERGEYKTADFMGEMKQLVQDIVFNVKHDRSMRTIELLEEVKTEEVATPAPEKKRASAEITCPKCKQGNIIQGKNAWGCSHWQEGCSFRIPFLFEEKKISNTLVKQLCAKGNSNGFVLNDDFSISYTPPEKEAFICPICKTGTVVQGKNAWGCMNYSTGCTFIVPYVIHEKKVSESSLKQLITKGQTPKLKGFVREGEKFDAALILNTQGKVELEE